MKAHRTDLVSFAFGLIFLSLAAWWLSAQLLGLALPPVGWFLAGALILIGVLGLVGALRSGRYATPDETGAPGAATADPTSGLPADATAPISGAGTTAPISGAGSPAGVAAPSSGAGVLGTDRPAGDVEPPIWETGWADGTGREPGPVEWPATAGGIHPAWQVDGPTREIGRDDGPTREIGGDDGSTREIGRDDAEPPTQAISRDADDPTQAISHGADEPPARPGR